MIRTIVRTIVRTSKRITCLLRGHDWQHSRVNVLTRRCAETCRRCRKRLVWKWPEGMVVWEATWRAEREGREPDHLPATVAESVERWRERERLEGRETK